MIIQYTIFSINNLFMHTITIDDAHGPREVSCEIPLSQKISTYPKWKCCICGTRGAFYCKDHQDIKMKYGKTIRQLKIFSKIGYTSTAANPESQEKRKATNVKRYGGTSPMSSTIVRDKVSQTNIANYGVANVFASPDIKNQIAATNLNRYGAANPFASPVIKEKIKKHIIGKFGVEFVSQSKDVQDKIKKTYQKRFGVDYGFQCKEIQEKIYTTNMIRYGGPSPTCSPDIYKKIENTNMNRYGCKSPMQNSEISAKRTSTNTFRYGFPTPAENKNVQDTTVKTNIDRYGCESVFQSATIRKKIEATNIVRYGHASAMKNPSVAQKVGDSIRRKLYGVADIMVWKDDFLHIMEHYGITEALAHYPLISMQTALRLFIPDSMKIKGSLIQDDVQSQLEALCGFLFESNVRSIVPTNNNLEIDILNRANKISIEFNGVYWHQNTSDSDIYKAKLMRSAGYMHLVIDETDVWTNKIPILASIINPCKRRIYARKCEIKEISIMDSTKFLNVNHIQGNVNASIRYGLYYGDELVEIMTFGKPRYSKDYDYELIRLCSKLNVIVIGGAERLYYHFTKYHSGDVISYSDYKYFSGKIYQKLGFKLVRHNKAGYKWYRDGVVLSRYQTMKHKLEKVIENFDPTISEAMNMQKSGYTKVQDLGQLVWEYK